MAGDEEFLTIEEHRRRLEHRGDEIMCPRCTEWVSPDLPRCIYCDLPLSEHEPHELHSPSQQQVPLTIRNAGGISIAMGIGLALLLLAMLAWSW